MKNSLFLKNFKKPDWIQIVNLLGLLIVALGIFTSIKMNMANRSLWLDEASLAQSLSTRSIWELTSKPLDNMQSAPMIFLYIVKIIIHFFGNTEFTLRILSVISYSAMLVFVAHISKNVLNIKFYMLPAAFLANMDYMLRYSNEFKQYMTEAAVALAVLCLYAWYSQNRTEHKRFVRSAILFMVLLWAAHSACFVVGGIICVEFFGGIISKDKERTKLSLWLAAGVLASFVANYFVWLKGGNSEGMQNYWKNNAFCLLPLSKEKLVYNHELVMRVFNSILNVKKEKKAVAQIILAALIFGAMYFAIREKREFVLAIFCSFALAFLASSIHMFPMENRLWCFSYPLFGILIFYTTNSLFQKCDNLVRNFFERKKTTGGGAENSEFQTEAESERVAKIVPQVLCVVSMFLLICTNKGITRYSNKDAVYRNGEETNPLIEQVQKNVSPNDKVFVFSGSKAQVKYKIGYNTNKIGNVNKDNIIWSAGSAENEKNLERDFDLITKSNSCWIITSHIVEKRWASLRDKLKESGTLKEVFNFHNTRLFHFKNSKGSMKITSEQISQGSFSDLSVQEFWEFVDKNTSGENPACILKGRSGDDASWGEFKNVWGLYTCYKQNGMDTKWSLKGSATVLSQNGDFYTLSFYSKTTEYKDITLAIKRFAAE